MKDVNESISDKFLRKDLISGIKRCFETASCSTQLNEKSKIIFEAVDFYKCYESVKTEACVKQDIRNRISGKLRFGFIVLKN